MRVHVYMYTSFVYDTQCCRRLNCATGNTVRGKGSHCTNVCSVCHPLCHSAYLAVLKWFCIGLTCLLSAQIRSVLVNFLQNNSHLECVFFLIFHRVYRGYGGLWNWIPYNFVTLLTLSSVMLLLCTTFQDSQLLARNKVGNVAVIHRHKRQQNVQWREGNSPWYFWSWW